jgi:hypothetical protein
MNKQEIPIEICIPRVENSVTIHQIFNIFKKIKIGYISKIIENPLRLEPNCKRIVIKIHWDNTKPLAIYMQDRLKNNKPIQIVYDMPFYWKLVANQQKKS